MIKSVEIKLIPSEASDEHLILQKAVKKAKVRVERVKSCQVHRRSIDARQKQVYFRLLVNLHLDETPEAAPALLANLETVTKAEKVIIVGAGPAGYFAALELIELGLKPIIFDRGKDVRLRRRDLKAIQQDGIVDGDSNYCFGEGGAGTYSDGKLYTRSHKRGNIEKVLRLLVEHGAKSDILVDAHPHIGSNKLPNIVANIRATIEAFGGEIHFGAKVTDFLTEKGRMQGVVVNGAQTHRAAAVILATGHSARDIYQLLVDKKISVEAKPFALGVRIEHPQRLIDEVQYRQPQREEALPAASYRLACQVEGRGVFSFCMCPGGLIVPAATAPGEIVVNGMSMSRRDSAFANAGTVVAVEAEDLVGYEQFGVFAGLEFQKSVESAMFAFGDGSQKAPGQRLTDFAQGKLSASLGDTSYIPGLLSAPLHELLPPLIAKRLRVGVREFGKKMKGYYTKEAMVIGAESRTSSPIRIPRNKSHLMHNEMIGLFPCGEGAGFAGGILSAAMDGQNVARAVRNFFE
ncbi:MAG: NAD(P)/FAD-dependent oxidoreductase [Saprospiraceae bacterium]